MAIEKIYFIEISFNLIKRTKNNNFILKFISINLTDTKY